MIRVFADSDIVVLVVRANGGSDALQFIHELDRRYQARFKRYFERLRDGHAMQSPQHIRRLNDGSEPVVHELKADKYRLYLIRVGPRWFVTHGREKPKDSQVAREAQKARVIFWEARGEQR
ncbi:hypothetical protein [Agromyces italicus]|uniref:hypothetical protein n=1 Tax=Agromyces italicus TaxID=279572 RepID=UPI0003B2E849|nr:hypothetical protein [Agromyces italicus]